MKIEMEITFRKNENSTVQSSLFGPVFVPNQTAAKTANVRHFPAEMEYPRLTHRGGGPRGGLA